MSVTSLVMIEGEAGHLKSAALSAVTAARALGGTIDLLVAGQDVGALAAQAAKIEGVARLLVADSPEYAHGLAENLTPLVVSLAGDYSHILMAATSFGKNLAPRVAALLDTQQISDITAVVSAECFVRPIYAGNVLATVETRDAIKVITVRATAFAAAEVGEGAVMAAPVKVMPTGDSGLARFIKIERSASVRPDLTAARVVVSGGRGMQSAENFRLLESIADKLGGAIGASRAAVDAGFISNDYQVGQTGKVVAPELYIAIGISGQIQHVAGMRESRVIVAINKDEEAPIFQIADYGLVQDLMTAVPELDAALGREKQ